VGHEISLTLYSGKIVIPTIKVDFLPALCEQAGLCAETFDRLFNRPKQYQPISPHPTHSVFHQHSYQPGQIENAQKCHVKAKQILDLHAVNIDIKENKKNYYNLYFHKRIGEELG
jgi:hypothetical protein